MLSNAEDTENLVFGFMTSSSASVNPHSTSNNKWEGRQSLSSPALSLSRCHLEKSPAEGTVRWTWAKVFLEAQRSVTGLLSLPVEHGQHGMGLAPVFK